MQDRDIHHLDISNSLLLQLKNSISLFEEAVKKSGLGCKRSKWKQNQSKVVENIREIKGVIEIVEKKINTISSLLPSKIESDPNSNFSKQRVKIETKIEDVFLSPEPERKASSYCRKRKINEILSPKSDQGTKRGVYIKVNPEIRAKLYQILQEQAQIWYDLNYNDGIDSQLKELRTRQLLSFKENKFDDSLVRFKSEFFSKVKRRDWNVNYSKNEGECSVRSSVSNSESKFIGTNITFSQMKHKKSLGPTREITIGDNQFLNQSLVNFSDVKIEYSYEGELDHDPSNENSKEANRGSTSHFEKRVCYLDIEPLKSLVTITIPEEDVSKYLKDNDMTIIELNKHLEEKSCSIFKTLSKICGVHEKTLRRIARGGPERKKGGGRKRLDSEMEDKLTNLVIDLNRKGRPPTRGEVKALGGSLSNVPNFVASKGWLDKYLARVQEDLKEKPNKEFFKIISFTEIPIYESQKSLAKCLKEIGLPQKILEKALEKLKTKIPDEENEFENSNHDGEESPEMISYPEDMGLDKEESIFIGDDDLKFTSKFASFRNGIDFY